VLNPDGTWDLTIPAANAIADGVYNVDVTVTDSAGNSATESTASELIIDTSAPAVPSIAPNLQTANDSGSSDIDDITSSTDNVFDVPANIGNPGDDVVLYADGVEIGTSTVAADGSFVVNASTLADGTYAITYTFTDSAGNTSVKSPVLNIEVDTVTTPPVIDQPIAIDDVVNAAEQTAVVISGTAEADSEVLVTLTDTASNTVVQSVITDGNGDWILTPLDISALVDGSIDVTAEANDVAGNTAIATPVSFLLDRAVPTITINPIALDNIINATEDDTDVVVNGSVTDVEDGQTVTVTLNGKNYTAIVAGGVWTFDLPALDAQALATSSTLTADVTNASGNAAVQATSVVEHDTTLPEITINPVAVDNIINATEDDANVAISGTSIGLEDGQQITLSINAQTYSATVTADAWTVDMPAADALALPAVNNLTADAQDIAGNPAAQVAVTVGHDVVAPAVAITSTVVATAANSPSYPVSGTCTAGDNDVVVSIAGASPASQTVLCTAAGQWNATFDVTAIADGTDVISIDATQSDLAGNSAAAATVLEDKNVSIPSLSIAVIAGDNYVNSVEDDSDVVISGTSSAIEDGQSVSVLVAGQQYTGTVAAGTWSVTAPAADVQAWGASEAITADANNVVGTAAQTANATVNHDTTLPATPAVTAQVTNNTQPTIEGTATLAPGDVLSVTVGGQTYTDGDGFLVANPDGTWVLTVDQPLAETVYDVTVTVTDIAGNTASETTLAELTIDTTSPAAPLVAPDLITADDSGSSDVDDITFVATASFSVPAGTATAGDAVELFANGLSIGMGVVEADGSFEIATAILTDDIHDVTYQLTDSADNTSVDSPALSVTLDTQIAPPVLTTPVAGDDTISASEAAAVALSGTAEAGADVTVSVSDGVNPEVTSTVTALADGSWSTTVDLSTLDDGALTVDVSATDVAGNSAASVPYGVQLDTTPAGIPTADTLVTNTATPTLTGTAALTAGDSLTVEVNGVLYTEGAGDLLANPDGTWTLTLPAADALCRRNHQ